MALGRRRRKVYSAMDSFTPADHGEAVAAFRHGVIGALLTRGELDHGELSRSFRALAKERFRPPGADATRSFAIATLERWYYAYRAGGLTALRPRRRSDSGRGRALDPALRALLCDIRREHPSASVPLILRTLEADGRLRRGQLAPSTLRRVYREEGLDRIALQGGAGPRIRLRWQTSLPDALWHGDVCHGPTILVAGKRTPVRVHGLMDDYSRFVVALEAHAAEREEDMLHVFVRAMRRHGKPDALYLDNGATYRGEILRLACARLGVGLIHARPYDPQARGKMERFWRTLRANVIDHLGEVGSLHDINVRLGAFLDAHYHDAPHAGLMGQAPLSAYSPSERMPKALDDTELRDAFTVRVRRRVRRDTTFSLEGDTFELAHGFLAGRLVTVAYCALDAPLAPWVELENKRYPAERVDPQRNARRARPPRREPPTPTNGAVPFDPPKALLDEVCGRTPRHEEEDDDAIF